jgi:hypothetical protein
MNPIRPSFSRRGIALIIVLGLMAMLTILAVAFITTMRTEYKAARMSGDQLGAVEMVYLGLAEALRHIDRDSDAGQWVCPTWNNFVLHSGKKDGNYGEGSGDNPQQMSWGLNDILVDYGSWFVPRAIFGAQVDNAPGVRRETNDVRWIRVKPPHTNAPIGQFEYYIIDCSGFLDPNANYSMVVDLATNRPRYWGTNVTELVLTNALLGELRRDHERKLFNGRVGVDRFKPFQRAETLPDLRVVAWAMYPDVSSLGGQSPFRITGIASNFFPFSYFPPGYADPGSRVARPQTSLVGTGAELWNRRAEIEEACKGLIPPNDIPVFVRNLIDYVDDDYVPGGLARDIPPLSNNADNFCTEAVPMLNELQIGCLYLGGSGKYTMRLNTNTELFFPFLFCSFRTNEPRRVTLRIKIKLEGGTFEPKDVPVKTVDTGFNYDRAWQRKDPEEGEPSSDQLKVVTFQFPLFEAPATNAIAPEYLIIEEWSLVDENDKVLDRLAPMAQGGVVARLKMEDYLSRDVNNPRAVFCGWEARDPRINWNLNDPNHWFSTYKQMPMTSPLDPTTTSLGKRNNKIPGFTQAENGEWVMYVANRPLYSIGELGYLLYRSNRPWETISFFPRGSSGGGGILPVLDRFTLFPYPRQGLVNLNSRVPAVLATAFNGCPVELAPGIPQLRGRTVHALQPSEALQVATNIITKRESIGSGFVNLSDIRNVIDLGDPNALLPNVKSWLAREGLIRNTVGLLGVRQNVFLVLVVGQSLRTYQDPESGASITYRVAGHRGAAVVWRDPYKDPVTGRYRTFVRNLRWYDEWIGTGEDYDPDRP